MDLKKKFNETVTKVKTHVSNNPTSYAYVAGVLVGSTAAVASIVYAMKDSPLIDAAKTIDDINASGLNGMYWEVPGKGTLVAFINENLENPLDLNA